MLTQGLKDFLPGVLCLWSFQVHFMYGTRVDEGFFPQRYPIVKKTVFSLFNWVGIFVKNQLTLCVWVHVMSSLWTGPSWLQHRTTCLQQLCRKLKLRYYLSSNFKKIALTVLGPLYFQANFRINFSISTQNPSAILIGITLKL